MLRKSWFLSIICHSIFGGFIRFFDKGDEKYFDKVEKYETAVNSIDEELTTYLIEISNEFLSVYENEILVSVLDSVRDLERILVDHLAVASANLSQHIHNKGN